MIVNINKSKVNNKTYINLTIADTQIFNTANPNFKRVSIAFDTPCLYNGRNLTWGEVLDEIKKQDKQTKKS